MPSFEFADCPTKLALAAASGTQEQSGSVRCTLRNTSARRQTARIRIEPIGSAKPSWFALDGAPSTAPLEIERDIDAGGTLSLAAAVTVPPKSPAGSYTFRLRVTSEAAPDTDFAEGPAIAFDVAAWNEPSPVKAKVPWWAIVTAVLLVLVVGGAAVFLAWPKGLDPALVRGKSFGEAQQIAAAEGFPDIKAQPGKAAGNDPTRQIVVGVGKDKAGVTVLLVDQGVPLPDLEGQPAIAAAKVLIDLGVLPAQSPQFDSRSDIADGAVSKTIPQAPGAVALGGTVTLVLNNKPNSGGGGTINPCLRNIHLCVDTGPVLNLQRQLNRDGLIFARPSQ